MYSKLVLNPEEYFNKLFTIGWLDDWSETDVEILKKSLSEVPDDEKHYSLYVLSEYSLDVSGVVSADDYVKLLNDLFDVFGLDIPKNAVSASQQGNVISVTVKLPVGEAVYEFEQPDDWMDDEILDFINDEVLCNYGIEDVIHPLPPCSTVIELVLKKPEVIDSAYDAGVLPEDDFFLDR